MNIIIDGEEYKVTKVYSKTTPVQIVCGRVEFCVFENSEEAGRAAAAHWEYMAENDPEDFVAIIGAKRLLQWALGQSDNYGISSLDEFLVNIAKVPEEEWASYDSQEREVDPRKASKRLGRFVYVTQELEAKIGFQPTVAYRCN